MVEDVKHAHIPDLERITPDSMENILSAARALDLETGDSFRELFLAGKVECLDRAWLQGLGLPPDDVAQIMKELSVYFRQIFARSGN